MQLLIRTFLVWLLVLGLAAQGAAAATMAFCGPDHHGGSAGHPAYAAAPAQHAHPGDGGDEAHQHHHAGPLADAESAPPAGGLHDGGAKGGDASAHKCSACASCCAAGAIPGTLLAVPMPVFAPTVFFALVPRVDSFAADGPERPPRFVPA